MFLARIRRVAIVCVTLLLLVSCGKSQPSSAAGDTPLAAVEGSVALIKAGDFAGFWKHALPPADYANLRADWSRSHAIQAPPSEEDRIKFEQSMAEFSAPDAANKLYAQLRPQLTRFQQQYEDQLPMLLNVLQQIAGTGIEQSSELSAEQKNQARAVLAVLAPWAHQVNWFDQDKARQAVAVVSETARGLDLKTVAQLRALSFDQAMQKYSVGFLGAKRLLALYGLSLDAALESVKLSVLESNQSSARVRADYQLLGKPLSMEFTLIQQDGFWYDRDLLQRERDAHLQLLQPPAAPSSAAAPTGTATAPVVAASAATAHG